jgi:type II secretory pathway component PulJ
MPMDKRGQSILEFVIAIGIFALLILVIGTLEMYIFKAQRTNQALTKVDQQIIILFRNFTKELRTAQQSNTGSYWIATAQPTELVFYADINNDSLIERIHYVLSGTTLNRGMIKPTGNPLAYNLASESLQPVVTNVQTGTLFTYYGSDYDGITALNALPSPVNLQSIQLIKLSVTTANPTQGLPPMTATTQVTIRNVRS